MTTTISDWAIRLQGHKEELTEEEKDNLIQFIKSVKNDDEYHFMELLFYVRSYELFPDEFMENKDLIIMSAYVRNLNDELTQERMCQFYKNVVLLNWELLPEKSKILFIYHNWIDFYDEITLLYDDFIPIAIISYGNADYKGGKEILEKLDCEISIDSLKYYHKFIYDSYHPVFNDNINYRHDEELSLYQLGLRVSGFHKLSNDDKDHFLNKYCHNSTLPFFDNWWFSKNACVWLINNFETFNICQIVELLQEITKVNTEYDFFFCENLFKIPEIVKILMDKKMIITYTGICNIDNLSSVERNLMLEYLIRRGVNTSQILSCNPELLSNVTMAEILTN